MQKPTPLPKTTLYSADGRTIRVFPSEVDAYIKVGWYKNREEAKAVGDLAKNKEKVSRFKVGQDVLKYLFVINKYGTVRDIDYNNGKLNIYWYRIEDSNGYSYPTTQGVFYGLYTTTWENASDLTPIY